MLMAQYNYLPTVLYSLYALDILELIILLLVKIIMNSCGALMEIKYVEKGHDDAKHPTKRTRSPMIYLLRLITSNRNI